MNSPLHLIRSEVRLVRNVLRPAARVEFSHDPVCVDNGAARLYKAHAMQHNIPDAGIDPDGCLVHHRTLVNGRSHPCSASCAKHPFCTANVAISRDRWFSALPQSSTADGGPVGPDWAG